MVWFWFAQLLQRVAKKGTGPCWKRLSGWNTSSPSRKLRIHPPPPPQDEPPQDIILLYPCSKILENQLKTLGETTEPWFIRQPASQVGNIVSSTPSRNGSAFLFLFPDGCFLFPRNCIFFFCLRDKVIGRTLVRLECISGIPDHISGVSSLMLHDSEGCFKSKRPTMVLAFKPSTNSLHSYPA